MARMSKRPPELRETPEAEAGNSVEAGGGALLERLQASRESLSEAQRIAHLGSWEWNIAEGTLSWSDEIYRIFGVEPQEFGATYEAFLGYVHPDDRDSVQTAVDEALEGKAPYRIEHRIVRPDGEERIVLERAEVTFDEARKPVRMLGTVQDISEQKRMLEELSRSEAFSRTLLDASPEALVLLDEDGKIVYVNAAAEALAGYSAEEALGKDALVYTSDPQLAGTVLEQIRREGEIRDLELQIEAKDGRRIDVILNVTTIVDREGKRRILVGGRDVSERKRAESALERERQRFDSILEILPAYLVLLAPDYTVPFANRFFRERFGESHGRRCYEYLFGRSEPCENCESFKTLETNAPHRWQWTGPDGRNYDIYDFPFTDADGSPLIMEMGIDITEQKQLESAMRDSQLYTRSLIEASLDAQMTTDSTGVITDVNAEMEALTGRSRQQLIGTRFSDYATDPERAAAGIEQVLREGAARDYELTIEAAGGHLTDVSFHATTYFDQAGQLRGVFAAARDITERKLHEQEREIARLFDMALDIAAIVGADGHFKRVNAAFEKTVGWTADELCSRPFEEFVHPDDRGPTQSTYDTHLHGSGIIDFENRYLCKDGSYRWLRWRTAPAIESGLVYTTARDVTEEKRREEEREHELKRIQALARLSAELVSAATPRDVFRVATSEATIALEAVSGAIGLLDKGGRELVSEQTGLGEDAARRFSRFSLDEDLPAAMCVRNGEALWFESMEKLHEQFPEAAALIETAGVRSTFVVPLLAAGAETIGFLSARFAEEREFSGDDRAFASTVADQCAQAIVRARAFEEREQALVRTDALQRISAGLVAAATPEQIADVFFEVALPALGAKAGTLGIVSTDRRRFHTRMSGFPGDFDDRFGERPIDTDFPSGVCSLEGRELWFESAAQLAEQFPVAAGVLAEAGVGASIYLPLLSEGVAIACVVAHFEGSRQFGDEEVSFARAVAGQCAQALERAGMLGRSERRLVFTRALQQLSSGLSGAATPAEVLDVIFATGLHALGSYSGSLGLVNEDRTQLAMEYSELADELAQSYAVVPLDSNLPSAACVRDGIPLWYESAEQMRADPSGGAGVIADAGFQALVCLPLMSEGKALGYLGGRFEQPHRFDEEERAFALSTAEQCGQALERARLLEESRRNLGFAESLQLVAAGLSGATTPAEVLDVIFNQVVAALGAGSGALGLLSSDRSEIEMEFAGPEDALSESLLHLPIDADFPGAATVRDGLARWYETPEQLRAGGAGAEAIAEAGHQAVASLPLNLRDETIGFLSARFDQPHRFSREERVFALTLAEQCAQALTRAGLYRGLENALDRTRALQDVSAGLAVASESGEVLQVIFEKALSALGADGGSLGLLSDDGLRIEAEYIGLSEELAATLAVYPIDSPLPAAVTVRESRAIWLESLEMTAVECPETVEVLKATGSEALISLPLTVDGKAIGFIGARFRQARHFSGEERALAITLADQCAQALVRVRLAEQREQALLRTELLRRVAEGLSTSSTTAEVAKVVFERVLPSIGVRLGRLGVLNADGSEFECVDYGITAGFPNPVPVDAPWPGPACVRAWSPRWYESSAELKIEFPEAGKLMAKQELEASFFLPLGAEQPIGFLVGAVEERGSLDEAERVFILTLASQCGQAMERVRLAEEREQALIRTRALQQVSAGLTAALTREDVLQVVFNDALSALGAESGALGVLREDRKTVETRRTGVPEAIRERFSVESIDDEDWPQMVCVRDGAEFWCSPLDELRKGFPNAAGILDELGFGGFACLPLVGERETIGYLAARFREQRVFSESDRAFARTVAEQCSQAIVRARLYEQRELALARTRLLQHVSAGLTRTATLEQVEEFIEAEVYPVLGIAAGSLGILDQSGASFRVRLAGWPDELAARYGTVSIDAPLPGPACARERRPLWCGSLASIETEFPELAKTLIGHDDLKSAFFVPLETTGEPIGFISGFFVEEREFGATERGFIETVAEQCAQAIARARLHSELHESLARAEMLQRVSTSLSQAATTGEVLHAIFDDGFGALGADAGALGTVDRERTKNQHRVHRCRGPRLRG